MTRHKTVYSKIRHRDQSLSISEANHLGNVQISYMYEHII